MENKHLLSTVAFILLLTSCVSTEKLKQAKENKETVRLWIEEGWNRGQNEILIPDVFDPEWRDENPLRPEPEGLEGMYDLIAFYKEALPDIKFTITHLFADENYAAVRYEAKATHHGDAFGIPATGKKITYTGSALYEMRDGKIYRSWHEIDLVSIAKQLKE